MSQADGFVIMDDVNYNKKSWVKRNRILNNGNIVNLSLPISKASQNKKINELQFHLDETYRDKVLKTIEQSYCKTQNFETTFPLIKEVMQYKNPDVTAFLTNSLELLSKHIGLSTKFYIASEINNHDEYATAQDRIIDVVKQLGGHKYLNLPGGKELYNGDAFHMHNIELSFIAPDLSPYPQQGTSDFVPALSIIDIMMNSRAIEKLS